MAIAYSDVGADKYTGYSIDGKPIVVTKSRGFPLKQARHNVKWWPEKTRIEAAALWAATRNYNTVSELTKVPVKLLKEWRLEPWFQNVVSRVVKDHNDVLDQKLTQIIDKCTDELADRLISGNTRVDKYGKHHLTPVEARDLAVVLGVIFDKRQLVRGEATSRTEAISADKRLEQLQQAFIQFSQATQLEGVKVNEQEESKQEAGQDETLLIEAEAVGEKDVTPSSDSVNETDA